jgi:hypothetical protein
MRGYKVAAIGGLVMSVLVVVAAQDGKLLRRELKTGAVDTYSFSMKSNQTATMDGGPAAGQEMPIDVGMTMKMALKQGAFDEKEKKAPVDVDVTEIALDLGSMGAMMGGANEIPKEMKLTAHLDHLNRLSGFKMPKMGMAGMMMGGGGGSLGPLFVEFPEAPVKVGDSWKMKMPPMPIAKGDTDLVATLTGEKEVDGKQLFTISVKGTMAVDGDMAEMMKDNPDFANSPVGGMKMLMKGTVDFDGEALVEKATGRTIKMNMSMKSKQNMDMPDMGMQVKVSGISTIVLSLIPPKA